MRLDSSNDRLSAKELLAISQEISGQFSPVFEAKIVRPQLGSAIKLSRKELLEISEEINKDFTPGYFPIQGTKLVLLAVDPGHLHAYWQGVQEHVNLSSTDTESPLLTLRLYSQPEQNNMPSKTIAWQDTHIQDKQTAQGKIRLPVLAPETAYFAAIGEHRPDGQFITFVHSNLVAAYPSTTLPYQPVVPATTVQAKSKNAAKNASGLGVHRPQ